MISNALSTRRRLRVWLTLLLSVALGACETDPPLELHGVLYFEAGPYLGEFRLATGDAVPVTNLGDQRIQRVSGFDNRELLLSIVKVVDERPRDRVVRFDLRTLHETPLLGAQAGQYLEASNSVLYYLGSQLIHAPRAQIRGGGRAIESFAWREPPLVVPVGEFGVLYAGPDGLIRRYDPTADVTEHLDALSRTCTLRDAVWISDRNQLACQAHPEDEAVPIIVLSDLHGRQSGVLDLPESRQFRPVASLPDLRVLILNETRRPWFSSNDQHPVWAYSMDTGRLQRLAENQHLGEAVVYRRTYR